MESIQSFLNREDVYFRGFDSKYGGVFDSYYDLSFSWVTEDPEYALGYARANSGKVAVIKVNSDKIGCVCSLNENADYIMPDEEDMQELYEDDCDGYGFYCNQDSSYCICARKGVLEVVAIFDKEEFSKELSKWEASEAS